MEKNLTSHLLEIQQKRMKYHKNGKAHYGKYLNLEDLLDVLLPELNERGVLITHTVQDRELSTRITLGTEHVESFFPMPDLQDPQKLGSAITYAKRYNLASIFNIVSDKDDDGEKAITQDNFIV